MLKRILMAVVAIGALVLTSSAIADGGDGNHDRIPDVWEKGHDPRTRDSDGDDENAGKVTAFAAGKLTISLFAGGDLTARVTNRTRVECERGDRDDDRGHDDDSDRDRRDSGDRVCPPGALAVGAIVEEAELKVTSAGRIWDEIELR